MDAITTITTILAVPGVSAIAAALLPRPAEGSRLAPIFAILDVLAANWLNARNKH